MPDLIHVILWAASSFVIGTGILIFSRTDELLGIRVLGRILAGFSYVTCLFMLSVAFDIIALFFLGGDYHPIYPQ